MKPRQTVKVKQNIRELKETEEETHKPKKSLTKSPTRQSKLILPEKIKIKS